MRAGSAGQPPAGPVTSPIPVIADLNGVIECDGISLAERETALESLKSDGVVIASSGQFLEEQHRWIGEALLANRSRSCVRYLPSRVVLVMNFCGRVKKTMPSSAK